MSFRFLDTDFIFPTNRSLFDRFLEDDDIELLESFVDALPKKKRRIGNGNNNAPQEANNNGNAVAVTNSNNQSSAVVEANNNINSLWTSFVKTDLIESENDYHVHVDVPGVDPENLEVSLDHKNLVIKAERKSNHEENNGKAHTIERSYGKTERRIRLPANADLDNCNTKLKNGVLTVTFPKKNKQTKRTLTVNTAEN